MIGNGHRIQRVARITGLSKDVIRVWERRFELLKPIRGSNRYRNYSDEDIALLKYLKKEVDQGISIGSLAAIGREELLKRMRVSMPEDSSQLGLYDRVLDHLIRSLDPLDRVAFERRLNGAVAVLPFDEALQGILIPLLKRVGILWHEGRFSIAIEHYVTRLVQQKLSAVINQYPVADGGPKVVIACPSGELHEVGAQAVAYHCCTLGFRPIYIGADQPIADLAKLCKDVLPTLVILSCPFSISEQSAVTLAQELRTHIAPISDVVIGGEGALQVKTVFEQEDIPVLETIQQLDSRIRKYLSEK